MEQRDLTLHCCECGRDFVFTLAEQLFFQSKQLSVPKRCRPCRAERKARLVPDMAVRHE